MSKQRKSILVVLAILVAVAGLSLAVVTVKPANAAVANATNGLVTIGMKGSNPHPTCPAPYVFSGKKASCVPCPQGTKYDASSKSCKVLGPVAAPKCETATTTSGNNTIQTTTCPVGVQASANDIDTGNVTILGYIMAKGLAKSVVSKLTKQGRCTWVGKGTKHPNFTNSGSRSGYGPYGKFADNRRTFACYTGKGPSGWQKVFDINPVTGKREHFCGNYLWFKLVKGLIKGKVIVVQNVANVHMHLHAEAHVYVTNKNCPGSYAEGSGSADITLSLSEYMRTRGPATSSLNGSATGKATAHAGGSVTCATPTTTVITPPPVTTTGPTVTVTKTTTTKSSPPPPTTTTTAPTPETCKVLSVETPEELYNDGETRPIRVQVTGQNGDNITLTYTLTSPLGKFYNPTVTFTSTGSDTEQATYTAPTDQSSVGQSTTINVSCHDNTTGHDGTPNHSDSFPIKAVPTVTTTTSGGDPNRP